MNWGAKLAGAVTLLWVSGCLFAATHLYLHVAHINERRLSPAAGDQSFRVLCHPPAGLQRAKCLSFPPGEQQAIIYIQQQTQPQDTIFVGALRHDKLYANDIAFYFLSGRPAATKWHDLHPGVEDTAPIQQEMIADLDRNRARFVVREHLFSYSRITQLPTGSRGATILDEYIDQNYRPARSFYGIDILRRATPFSGQSGP
jgi:hypothetical protein